MCISILIRIKEYIPFGSIYFWYELKSIYFNQKKEYLYFLLFYFKFIYIYFINVFNNFLIIFDIELNIMYN